MKYKQFIQLTRLDGKIIYIDICSILSFNEERIGTFVSTYFCKSGSYGIRVKESVEELLSKIRMYNAFLETAIEQQAT